jgi:hypothetical protein
MRTSTLPESISAKSEDPPSAMPLTTGETVARSAFCGVM